MIQAPDPFADHGLPDPSTLASQQEVAASTFDGADNAIRIRSMRGAAGPVERVRDPEIRMHGVDDAIVLDLTCVDSNRPDFRGGPTRVPSIRGVVIDHVTVTGSKNAGRIVGLPDSPITGVTPRDVSIAAEEDLVVRDADAPVVEKVTRDIPTGAFPARPAVLE